MPILIKKSNTPSALPSVVYGELACNVNDKKLYIGNFSNSRILLANGNLLPSNAGTAGQVLQNNGSSPPTWVDSQGGFHPFLFGGM